VIGVVTDNAMLTFDYVVFLLVARFVCIFVWRLEILFKDELEYFSYESNIWKTWYCYLLRVIKYSCGISCLFRV